MFKEIVFSRGGSFQWMDRNDLIEKHEISEKT